MTQHKVTHAEYAGALAAGRAEQKWKSAHERSATCQSETQLKS
jgi:hypothetical protein